VVRSARAFGRSARPLGVHAGHRAFRCLSIQFADASTKARSGTKDDRGRFSPIQIASMTTSDRLPVQDAGLAVWKGFVVGGPVSVGPGGDVCRRPRRPGGGGRRRPATAGLRQLVVPPRFKRVDQAPHGTAAPHLKRFAAEKRPFPTRGDTQGAMTASIVLSRRCKMTVCND